MRDISKIETRLKNLENYTSLNLLEKDTKELTIKNALGQDKFKHGFMSNPFHVVHAHAKNRVITALNKVALIENHYSQ